MPALLKCPKYNGLDPYAGLGTLRTHSLLHDTSLAGIDMSSCMAPDTALGVYGPGVQKVGKDIRLYNKDLDPATSYAREHRVNSDLPLRAVVSLENGGMMEPILGVHRQAVIMRASFGVKEEATNLCKQWESP